MPENKDTDSPLLAIAERYLRRPLPMLLVLACITFGLYRTTLNFGFVWDDQAQIINNPLIRTWDSVGRVFMSDLWFHTNRGQLYYRPLFIVWSILNYALFALRPWGWHLASVSLYLLSPTAVFLLGRKLGLRYWTAALGALLFAVHPVHIECVAWVSAASDTMVTLFYIFAFIALLNIREKLGWKRCVWYAVSLVLLGCALLTKEMAITFPATAALYFWMFPEASKKGERFWAPVRIAVPYAVMTGSYLLVRKLALHKVVATFDPEHTIVHVLATLPLVLSQYLKILVAPFGLTGLYYTPYVESFGIATVVVPVGVLAFFIFLIRHWVRRTADHTAIFLVLWTLVTLTPVLYLRNFGNGDFVRDRYIFLPSVGFILLAAKAIELLPRLRTIPKREVQLAVSVAICAILCWGVLSQQIYWKSNLLVFKRGHDLYPENTYATMGLANSLSQVGDHEQAAALLEKLTLRDPNAWELLAQEYAATGRIAEGRRALASALKRTNSTQSEIGTAELAGVYGRLGDYDKALDLCSKVLEREPDLYAALYNCGNIAFLAQRYDQAEQLLTRATNQAGDLYEPHYFLGRVLIATGRSSEGEKQLRWALKLNERDYQVHYWLGVVLEGSGNLREAREEYQKSIILNPDFPDGKARLTATENKLKGITP